MGGCRCTYRNCSLRTDGKTHMFHYPVFDKVRCHQWLTNAHKLEFLNLKVSQLKNRVVCQHHFKDDNFMNFKKDKLTFDAVPTEDGPYCDSSQLDETKTEQEESKVFSISLDDIENEYLTIVDKKANFSVKYGNFLTNCDLMDLDSLNSLNQKNDSNQIAINGLSELATNPMVPKDLISSKRPVKRVQPRRNRGKHFGNSSHSILKDTTPRNRDTVIEGDLTINNDNTVDISKLIETPRTEEDQNPLHLVLNVSHVPIEFEGTKTNDRIQENINQSIDVNVLDESKLLNDQLFHVKAFDESKLLNDQSFDIKGLDEPKPSNSNADRRLLKRNKIRIISEKKISEPLSLNGKLEPVSPTRILTFPNKKSFLNPNPTVEIPEAPITNSTLEILGKSECEPMNIISSSKDNVSLQEIRNDVLNIISNEVLPNNKAPQTCRIDEINKSPNKVSHNTSLLRNKISPERVAAIAEKRKPMNIISTRKDNVSPQDIRNNVINIISNEALPNNAPQTTRIDEINNSPNKVSPNNSLLRNKIPAERVAAIAEKRKFNMKLRDIIEDCLDKLDKPDKSDFDKRKLSHKTKIMQCEKQQVRSHLAKDPELPSVQDYTIAYLEARMKKMEDNLLNKIEENSQKIVELKQTVAPSCDKKNVRTQTSVSEDVHKRQLYQELSKYLTQEANSLIYEELFINKYTKDVPPKGSTPSKRRKRR